jgi:hypothetical protein
MSLLPTITWLNIPFSPHQHAPAASAPKQARFTGWDQYDGAMIGKREKSLPSPSPRRRGSGTWSDLRHFWPNRDAPARAAIAESGDLTAACTPAGFDPLPPLAEAAQAILLHSPTGMVMPAPWLTK